jgi:hypothetical protein
MGMKAYFPHYDVYDPEDPNEVICEGALFDETSVKVSDLLFALQQVLDPNKDKQELSDAIDRYRQYESSSFPLVAFL